MDQESNNGHQPKRVVLYARVSTDEQARSGFSLAQQLEALREHAAREEYEVLEEVADRGHSGASLARPGMDRVRDLVATSDVSIVLAQDRDRFAREPAYHYLLRKEFEEHGATLRALNDRGDDSPEGALTDGILDQLSKYERAKTAERTRRGKLRKAREGKVIAGATPNYGFRYNAARDGYKVDEDTMPTVRRIFRMVGAERASLYAVQRTLELESVSAPKGGRYWSRSFLRRLLLEDVYKPHTFEEIATRLSEEVAGQLDEDKRYGIWWFNRVRATQLHHREQRRKFTEKPKEEWVAVPVPDAGIPREWVEAAREALKYNYRSKNKHYRYWELAGGIIYCGECGRRMIGHSMSTNRQGRPQGKRRYFYYVCPKKALEHNHSCKNKGHRAEPLERKVKEAVGELLMDPSRLQRRIEERIDREREIMRNPGQEIGELTERLERLALMRRNYQDQQAVGHMSLEELGKRLSELDESRDAVQRELETARGRHERIEELKIERRIILELYSGFALGDLGLFPPHERRRLYEALGVRVAVNADRRIEVRGNFEADYFPPEKETHDLVAGIVYSPEQQARREAFRTAIAGEDSEQLRSLMSMESTSTCSACST